MSDRVVMIVEDDMDLREAIVEVLELGGYSVIQARHGEDALKKLHGDGHRPRLILLDLMMPVMDGFGFRRLQSADPELNTIPVVVLTAHGNVAEIAAQMRATAFLNKPVEPDVLLDTVAQIVG